ncbi:MAG: acyltransferase, partial [Bryobacteraceae bacterium]
MTPGKRIPSLDGLRALSIVFVIICHMLDLHRQRPLNPIDPYNYLLTFGGLGVEIFFVISGFLITTLLLREAEDSGSFSLWRFYVRRFFRIVPPFYVFLAVVAIATSYGLSTLRPLDFLVSGLFTTNYLYVSP